MCNYQGYQAPMDAEDVKRYRAEMSEFFEAMDVFFNGRSPGSLNEVGKRIRELENQLRESFERIERMRITIEELRREKKRIIE